MKTNTQPRSPRPSPRSVELCAAAYAALRTGGKVYLFAHGVHRGMGHQIFLEDEKGEGPVPKFTFWHRRPPERGRRFSPAAPFSAHVSFEVRGPVEHVVVRDGRGWHKVEVEPVPHP